MTGRREGSERMERNQRFTIAAYKFAASPDLLAQKRLRNLRAELCDLKNACLQQRTEAYGARGGQRAARRGGIIVNHAEGLDPTCDCGSKKKWRLCCGQAEIAETTAALRSAFPGIEPRAVLLPVREKRLSLQRQIGKSQCGDCGDWCAVVGRSDCHGAEIIAADQAAPDRVMPDDFIGPLPLGRIRASVLAQLDKKKVCATCLAPVGRRITYLSACHLSPVQQYPGQSEELTALRQANEEDPNLSSTVRRPGKGRRRARIWHDEVPRAAQTDALERLEKGYEAAFGRLQRGDKAGFPRYQKRRDYRSIGIQWDHGISLEGICPACRQQVGTPDARTTEAHARTAGKRVTAESRCPGSEGPLCDPGRPLLVLAWGRGKEQRRIEMPLRIHVSRPLSTAARGLQEAERSVGQPGSFARAVAAILKAQPELGGIQGIPKHCIVSEEADGRWFAVIQCDEVPAPRAVPTERQIGVDLGWSGDVLAVLSDGTEIPHPRFGEQIAARLAATQQALSRKLRPPLSAKASQAAGMALAASEGRSWAELSKKARRAYLLRAVHGKRVSRSSKRREKRVARVAVVQALPAQQRKDFVHKVSHGLVYGGKVSAVAGLAPFFLEAAGRIALEKLAIRDMAERAHSDPEIHDPATLNRRNADSAWGALVAQTLAKGNAAGRSVLAVPAVENQKRGGRVASAKKLLATAQGTWFAPGIQTEGDHTGGNASPAAGAGPVPETSRATKPLRGRNRRLGEAGGSGTDAPMRGGREGSSPGTAAQVAVQDLPVEARIERKPRPRR